MLKVDNSVYCLASYVDSFVALLGIVVAILTGCTAFIDDQKVSIANATLSILLVIIGGRKYLPEPYREKLPKSVRVYCDL